MGKLTALSNKSIKTVRVHLGMSIWLRLGMRRHNIIDLLDKVAMPMLSEARVRQRLPQPMMSWLFKGRLSSRSRRSDMVGETQNTLTNGLTRSQRMPINSSVRWHALMSRLSMYWKFSSRSWPIRKSKWKKGMNTRVPWSDQAIEVLKSINRIEGWPWVFESWGKGKRLSNMAKSNYLKGELDFKPYTVHGVWSSFCGWAGEAANHSSEVVEQALAYSLADQKQDTCQRSEYLNKHRNLMADWAIFFGVSFTIFSLTKNISVARKLYYIKLIVNNIMYIKSNFL